MRKEVQYTPQEQMLIDLFTQKIKELEDEVADLKLIISHNADLDNKKLLSITKNSKGRKTLTFDKKLPS